MTEVFVLMRNNAIQNRSMYDERVSGNDGGGWRMKRIWFDLFCL